jgi:hypothetical protein
VAPFDGGVDGVERERRDGLRRPGPDVDDGAAPRHPGQHRGRHLSERPQVHPHHPHPHLHVGLVQVHRARLGHAGVVHHHADVQPVHGVKEPQRRLVALRRGCEGEVEHDGLRLHLRAAGGEDRVGDILELGGDAADEDEVEPAARELQRHGPADSQRRAGDYGPRAVAAAEVRRLAKAAREVGQETERRGGEVGGAERGQREKPGWLLQAVAVDDGHLSLSLPTLLSHSLCVRVRVLCIVVYACNSRSRRRYRSDPHLAPNVIGIYLSVIKAVSDVKQLGPTTNCISSYYLLLFRLSKKTTLPLC